MFFVTHLYDFAHGFHDRKTDRTIFLRAERQDDGKRPFRIVEAEPLQTSYGEDLFNNIFNSDESRPSGLQPREKDTAD